MSSEAQSSSSQYTRMGALMGLASCAIGVSDDITNYIAVLLPPVLNCFDDEEARIRFYAYESLYNIVKAARKDILIFINEIFSTLCELYADVDVEVKEISFEIAYCDLI